MTAMATRHPQYLALVAASSATENYTLPRVAVMLEAFDEAIALPGLSRRSRTALSCAAAAIRDKCPERIEIVTDKPCARCPAGAADLATIGLGHGLNAHQTYAALLRARITTPGQIAALTDPELTAINRLGKPRAATLRTAMEEAARRRAAMRSAATTSPASEGD